jgi:hypothetical protein
MSDANTGAAAAALDLGGADARVPREEADLATKKQKARAAAAGKDSPAKPKPKKKTSRGK